MAFDGFKKEVPLRVGFWPMWHRVAVYFGKDIFYSCSEIIYAVLCPEQGLVFIINYAFGSDG